MLRQRWMTHVIQALRRPRTFGLGKPQAHRWRRESSVGWRYK